jgi:dihydroorotase
MNKYHLSGGWIVNEGKIFQGDIWIEGQFITRIDSNGLTTPAGYERIDISGLHVIPGIIDTHVHFREPGLTHKATMRSESMAAIAGGVCSVVDMPNTLPPTTSLETLKLKKTLAQQHMFVNYGFYVAVTEDNFEKIDSLLLPYVAGIKLFYGSSTGNLLFRDPDKIEWLFKTFPHVRIAVHSEDDAIIQQQLRYYVQKVGEKFLEARHHPLIRNRQACLESTNFLLDLALTYQTQLHFLHITTTEEVQLLQTKKQKHISAETCVHYLWFTDADYDRLGNLIKCNPAIKSLKDQEVLFQALKQGVIDLISTDHAPHTLEEKEQPYMKAPSGIPSIQFGLPMMLTLTKQGKCSLLEIIDWMAHRPAELFRIDRRGFLREDYFADLVIIDIEKNFNVSKEDILSSCKWSPLEGASLQGKVIGTFVNGKKIFWKGNFFLENNSPAEPLFFIR